VTTRTLLWRCAGSGACRWHAGATRWPWRSNTFGPNILTSFKVWTDEVEEEPVPGPPA
jgi:hypothetical protein